MTEILDRPSRSSLPPHPAAPRRWLPAAGTGAALRAASAGLLLIALPVLLSWGTDSRAGAATSEVLRSIGQLWLLAHGAALEVPGGTVDLLPLGLTAVPLMLLLWAGRWAAGQCRPTSPRAACSLAFAVAVPYALLCALVAGLSATASVRPSALQALLGGFLVALVGAGAGALRADRLWRAAWLLLPSRARQLLPAVGAASAVLLAGGALLAGLSLAWHVGRAAELAGASDPGPVGAVALLLVGLSLVPNAALWGASWLAGPGFAVGAGTSVGPFGHELGPVPALPLLAGLPDGGAPTWVGLLALLVPLGAGALAGLLVLRAVRRSDPDASAVRVAMEAAATGPVCGVLWLVLAALAGGPVGGDRLTEIGPVPLELGLAVAVQITVGAVLAALLLRRRPAGNVTT